MSHALSLLAGFVMIALLVGAMATTLYLVWWVVLVPEQVVPSFLYPPDGRVVPTCVIWAEQVAPKRTVDKLTFPSRLIGGGYPILTDVQGQMHIGSMGCLVTDGDSYALTNAPVTGEAGREVFTLIRGERRRVGQSHTRQIGRIAFEAAYPGCSATRSQLNVDAGLIRVSARKSAVADPRELKMPDDRSCSAAVRA